MGREPVLGQLGERTKKKWGGNTDEDGSENNVDISALRLNESHKLPDEESNGHDIRGVIESTFKLGKVQSRGDTYQVCTIEYHTLFDSEGGTCLVVQ